MPPTPPERDVAPTVQRIRLRYAKRGRLRFASHRDFQRALERALRRADVPIAFSAGFSPHPKISYANAAPTGAASEAEYLEIGLMVPCDPDLVREALDAALPPGLDIVDAVEARTPDLVARLEASVWEIALPGVTTEEAEAALAAFLAADEVPVERLMKSGMRTFDARGAVVHAETRPDPAIDCAILRVVVRHGSPSVRPDDVLSALRRVADLVPPTPPRATRLAQGPLDDAGAAVADPLDPDRVR